MSYARNKRAKERRRNRTDIIDIENYRNREMKSYKKKH